jgi:hypothetical protein
MTISLNGRLTEQASVVMATGVGDLTSAAYVSMKNYRRLTIIAAFTSTGTVSGGVVTLSQATAVAGTGAKALAFTRMLANVDVAASQTLVETAVTSNTFTVATTTTKRVVYIIEIDSDALDATNSFDCVKFVSTALVNATGIVTYILHGARYTGADAVAD